MDTSPRSMRAAVFDRYGGPEVVRIEQIARPAPGPGEILIKTRATTVTSADWRLRSMNIPKGFGFIARLVFGYFKPRRSVLGTELSGVIAEIGSQVSKWKVGDEVFCYTGAQLGAHAEFRCLSQDALVAKKPENLSFEQAAALCFGGVTALFFLRDHARIQRGEKLLVIGASGNVGSAAVQIGKHFGAFVTGICSSANVDLVKSLGADQVVDYKTQDWTKLPTASFDVILDTVGGLRFEDVKALLCPGGRLLLAVADFGNLADLLLRNRNGYKICAGDAKGTVEDLQDLRQMAINQSYKPLIQQVFAFEDIVDAHRVVDGGRKRGSIVIKL